MPPTPLSAYGAKIGNGDPKHTAIDDKATIACDGFDCPYVGYDPATGIATFAVTTDPDVAIRVPGKTIKGTGTFTVDVYDAIERIEANGGSASDLRYKVPLEAVRGDKVIEDKSLWLRLGYVAEARFANVVRGKKVAFALDANARFTRDAMARMTKFDPKIDDPSLLSILPDDASIGQVDLVALEANVERTAGSCAYQDEAGHRVDKPRLVTDRRIDVFDRRTGAKIASKTVYGPTPACAAEILATAQIYSSFDEAAIDTWERSLLKAHPGEPEAVPTPIGLLGTPETGLAADLPSKLLVAAGKLGIADPTAWNHDDLYDNVTGSAGDTSIDLHELRMRAVVPGVAAFGTAGGLAVSVAFDHETDATLAKTLLATVLAKAPDVAAMLEAAKQAHDHAPNKDPVDADAQAWDLYLAADKSDHDARVSILRIDRSHDPKRKLACRVDAKHALCVETDGDAKKLLARI